MLNRRHHNRSGKIHWKNMASIGVDSSPIKFITKENIWLIIIIIIFESQCCQNQIYSWLNLDGLNCSPYNVSTKSRKRLSFTLMITIKDMARRVHWYAPILFFFFTVWDIWQNYTVDDAMSPSLIISWLLWISIYIICCSCCHLVEIVHNSKESINNYFIDSSRLWTGIKPKERVSCYSAFFNPLFFFLKKIEKFPPQVRFPT